MASPLSAARRLWALVATAAVAVVGIAILVVPKENGSVAVGPPIAAAPSTRAADTPLESPHDAHASARPGPGPTENAEVFLANFWGADWPRIEAELRKQEGWADFDLSTLPLPPPFEEALPRLREQLAVRTPAQRDSSIESYLEIGTGSGRLEDRQWIQSKYAGLKQLGESEYATILAHVGPAQQVLETSAARIVDAIHEARLRLFDQGERSIAPYSCAGLQNPRENMPGLLSSKGFGWEGWAVSILVLQSDVPGYDEMRAENLELIRERNRQLRQIIATF